MPNVSGMANGMPNDMPNVSGMAYFFQYFCRITEQNF